MWEETVSAERQQEEREKVYFRLISYLNDHRLHGISEVFDCGDLELAWIYWERSHWAVRWLEPKPIPKEVLNGV